MTKTVVDTGLPQFDQPFSWAVMRNGMLFTAHGPVGADGSVDTGAIEDQARLTFANLKRTLEAAGGSLADVMQVVIYMVDIGDMRTIDGVYREFFAPPYPNRSSSAVAALVVPGMKIEITAIAMLTSRD